MTMNNLGKALVLINVTVSVMLCAFALAVYTSAVDWGWKDPRRLWMDPPDGKKEPANERAASELDQRIVAMAQAADIRKHAEQSVEQAKKRLAQVEGRFAENRVFYAAELARLEKAPGKIEDKVIQFRAQKVVQLDAGGKPVLAPPTDLKDLKGGATKETPIEKSHAAYLTDLDAKQKAITETANRIKVLTAKVEEITSVLVGQRDKDGKMQVPGYYDLLEAESVAQKKLKEELDYVQPLWVRELVNAQLLVRRQESLKQRLKELGEPAK